MSSTVKRRPSPRATGAGRRSRGTPPETLVDRYGCSLDQLVPCDGPWKNHGQFEKAFKEAEHSDCGKKR